MVQEKAMESVGVAFKSNLNYTLKIPYIQFHFSMKHIVDTN